MAGENSFIMFIRIHKLRKDNSAQAAVFAALILLVLVMFVMLVVDVGQLVTWRIRMQNAADSAAMAGAVWQARGLNVIAALNIVWVPAFIIDLISLWFGNPNFSCTTLVQKIQDVMVYAIPVMAITQVVTYGRANKADIAVPLPTAWAQKLSEITSINDVKGIYTEAKCLYEEIKSEGLGALKSSIIPCWLNAERITVFILPSLPPREFGPMTGGEDVYTFALAYKGPQPVLIGGTLLGTKKTPAIYTTAKAVPYGGKLGGKIRKITEEKDVKYSEKKDKKGKTKKDKDKGKTETHLTAEISFGDLIPKPDYKAKFDKTGFERILMVH